MYSYLQYTGYKNKIKFGVAFFRFGSVCSSQSHEKTLMCTMSRFIVLYKVSIVLT